MPREYWTGPSGCEAQSVADCGDVCVYYVFACYVWRMQET
jgi:hypothetical protein